MTTEAVIVDGQAIAVEVRRLTIICESAERAAGPPIEYPSRIVLDPEVTLYHADRVRNLDPRFEEIWRLFHSSVYHGIKVDTMPTADEIRKMGRGCVHLMGLFDLTLKLGRKGVPLVWRHPESFLHPGWQVGLAEVAIYLS